MRGGALPGMKIQKLNFTLLVALALSLCSSVVSANFSTGCEELFSQKDFTPLAPSIFPKNDVRPEELLTEVSQAIARVPEFRLIRMLAEQKGVRIWLFGGTASSFVHYVKRDLKAKKSRVEWAQGRFHYDFTDIFRSTQDIDLVVDAPPEVTREFEAILVNQFPQFFGEKAGRWEVRSLRHRISNPGAPHFREALLNDPDFEWQNSDSHSLGLVEVTTHKDDPVILDLRSLSKKQSVFLKDVIDQRIHFFRSPQHFNSARAMVGENPEILSVLRVLVKAFQFDLKFSSQDWKIIRKISNEFNPILVVNPTAQKRIKDTAIKLVTQAENVERAMRILDGLGLREKLISMGNLSSYGSVAWWLSKEPLRSKSVGQGTGRTARELQIEVVAHETYDFRAYESITRSYSGYPNVFISRNKGVGEIALYGEGFYTSLGRQGSRSTGITIRFKVDPNAREETDFHIFKTVAMDKAIILFSNKRALRIIPESLVMSPSQYFDFLAKGGTVSPDDQAILSKLERMIQNRFTSGLIDSDEMKRIDEIVLEQVKSKSLQSESLFLKWIRFKAKTLNEKYNHFLDLIGGGYKANPAFLAEYLYQFTRGTVLESWVFNQNIPMILKFMKKDIGDSALQKCLFSDIASIRKWGEQVLFEALQKRPSHYLRALAKVSQEGQMDNAHFREASQRWLSSVSNNLDPILLREKAAFISRQTNYSEWIRSLPKNEVQFVLEELSKQTVVSLFDQLAEKQGQEVHQIFLQKAKSESFQFVNFTIPQSGMLFEVGSSEVELGRTVSENIREERLTESFEVQTTALTEFQKALLLGEDLSKIQEIGNHPAVKLSWEEARKLADRMNELDPYYFYRLPYDVEREYFTRAGTRTSYSFGDSVDELSDYAIYIKNSESRIQDVAMRKPNPAGLYDVHGGVSEWCEDLSNTEGLRRVRGGSWNSDPYRLRSAGGYFLLLSTRLPTLGVRLIRVRRNH